MPTQPPHSLAAERQLIGALLVNDAAIHAVLPVAKPEYCYDRTLREIFAAIVSVSAKGNGTEPTLICDELERKGRLESTGGMATLTKLITGCESALDAVAYAGAVADYAMRRRALAASSEIAKAAYRIDEPIDALRETVESESISVFNGRGPATATTTFDVANEIWSEMEFYANNPLKPGQSRGLDTGWGDLNRALGGWRKGLYVIIAVPHAGKTWFCLHTMASACSLGKRVAYISLEMTSRQLVSRLCLAYAQAQPVEYESGQMDGDKLARFQERLGQITDWKGLVIQDQIDSITQITSFIRREHTHRPLDLVVIDSLNLVTGAGDTQNRNLELGIYTRRLQNLARQLRVPILTPHHASSKAIAQRSDKRPQASDGYESGHIEQDVDGLLSLYRDEMYNPDTAMPHIMEVKVLKDRLGGGAGRHVDLFFTMWGGLKEVTTAEPPPHWSDN